MNNRIKLEKKLKKLHELFPAELPGVDMIAEFDLEDDRIESLVLKYLKGEKINKPRPIDDNIKKLVIEYLPKDDVSKKIHQDNLNRLRNLEEIIDLLNKCIDEDEKIKM